MKMKMLIGMLAPQRILMWLGIMLIKLMRMSNGPNQKLRNIDPTPNSNSNNSIKRKFSLIVKV